jgi:DNA-binding protein H-NS
MAKKALKKTTKRMGRPKGSKNKNADKGLIAQFSKMAFDAQQAALSQMASMYESAKTSRAAELIAELGKLGISTGKKRGRPAKDSNGGGHVVGNSRRAGKTVAAKFRSKVDASKTWAGRGLMPKWLVAEMKAGKLKKEDFAI